MIVRTVIKVDKYCDLFKPGKLSITLGIKSLKFLQHSEHVPG